MPSKKLHMWVWKFFKQIFSIFWTLLEELTQSNDACIYFLQRKFDEIPRCCNSANKNVRNNPKKSGTTSSKVLCSENFPVTKEHFIFSRMYKVNTEKNYFSHCHFLRIWIPTFERDLSQNDKFSKSMKTNFHWPGSANFIVNTSTTKFSIGIRKKVHYKINLSFYFNGMH